MAPASMRQAALRVPSQLFRLQTLTVRVSLYSVFLLGKVYQKSSRLGGFLSFLAFQSTSAGKMLQYPRICQSLVNRPFSSTTKLVQSSLKVNRLLAATNLSKSLSTNGASLLANVNNSNWKSQPLYIQNRKFRLSSYLSNELRDVVVPALAESLSEGDIRWEKAVGDSVSEDEVVGEVETDKTSVPIHSPVAGVIEELLVEDGSTVEPGKVILRIRVGAGGGAKPAASKPAAAEPAAAAAPAAASAPAAQEPSSKSLSSSIVSSVKSIVDSLPGIGGSSGRKETRVKTNRMRQRIAQRLKDAQNTYAMLTTFNEVDMSNVIGLRNQYKDAFQKKHNIKLGFMSAFVKASAFALQDQPVVNAVIDGNEIVYRDYIDISVAVATSKGLVVPVIRNVEEMNYLKIEKTIHELGEKAKSNSLAIEDMDGGTFTISNGGVFGSMFGTPIINPPQSAILGMHAIIDRPVAINGKVEIRPMMYICLTYDHRLIDGREAVLFLRKIKSAVEDPRVLLLDI